MVSFAKRLCLILWRQAGLDLLLLLKNILAADRAKASATSQTLLYYGATVISLGPRFGTHEKPQPLILHKEGGDSMLGSSILGDPTRFVLCHSCFPWF